MSTTQPQLRANEADLIKSACAGKREAFYELVRPYERMIYATAFSVMKNPADAEEIAQEAVLKAFSHLSSFRAESKFSTWLVQITYNEAKMKLRKARPHLYESIDDQQQTEEGDFWPRDFADWRPIPSELLEQNEIRRTVQDAINSLSPSYREALVLRDVQHLSIKETSTILGISEPNVKTRLHRARLLLRDRLAPGMDGSWTKGQPYRKARAWWKKEGPMATIEISCVEVWREISNYLEDEISPEMRERMETHFKVCAHCTAVLDGTRNVVKLVGDGRVFQMPDGFSKRLYSKLQNLP
jgi:RNA polymerase sigma-70 factor (ECF subfamily)